MTYYLNLFSPQTWNAARSKKVALTGFRKAQRGQALKVVPGDIFLCYLVGISRWSGALKVASELYEDDTVFYTEPDPFTIRFKVDPIFVFPQDMSLPIVLDGLWDKLSITCLFQKGSLGWGNFFQSSLREISEVDGNLILDRLAAQAAQPVSYPLTSRDLRKLARYREA